VAILNWGGDPGSSFHREKGKWLPFVVVVGGEGRRPEGVLRWMVELGCQSQSYKEEILLIHENAGNTCSKPTTVQRRLVCQCCSCLIEGMPLVLVKPLRVGVGVGKRGDDK